MLPSNCSPLKRVDRNRGFHSVDATACVSEKQTKRKYVTALILCDIPLTPLLPLITEDMWYRRLFNCSVTTSMCLQAQCLLCCYHSFKPAVPVGWTHGGIDFVIVQISRESKCCWCEGTEWVEVGGFISCSTLGSGSRFNFPRKHSLCVMEEGLIWSVNVCLSLACLDQVEADLFVLPEMNKAIFQTEMAQLSALVQVIFFSLFSLEPRVEAFHIFKILCQHFKTKGTFPLWFAFIRNEKVSEKNWSAWKTFNYGDLGLVFMFYNLLIKAYFTHNQVRIFHLP